MIAIAMSTVVHSPRDRVWRALTVPAEVVRWDERMEALVEPVPDYPSAGQLARWRCRMGAVPVELRDRPLEVVPGQRLRSDVRFGLFHFEETYTLVGEPDTQGPDTRLSLRLAASNVLPLVGGALDRFAVRSMASEIVDANLRAIQKWCETHPE